MKGSQQIKDQKFKYKVSVIIPAYNSHRTMDKSVKGLALQTAYNAIREVIIVDSSDNEDSLKQLDELRKKEKIKVITSGVRVMPARQRNIGAKEADCDILCFLDSDAFPAADWIEKIIQVYSEGIRVGGGSYKVPDFQKGSKIAKAQYYLEFNEYINSGKPRKKKMLPSCNLFCERELFLTAGGFPEIRASEDTLFGLKINEYSPIIFFPDISVYHIFREQPDHYFNNQKLLGKYIFIYRKFFYNSYYYKGILPYIFFPGFILVKMMRIFTRIIRAGRKHIIQFIPVSGFFLKGLIYWGKGFLEGIRDYKKEKAALSLEVKTNGKI